MIHLIWPVGTFGLSSPQHTSREVSPEKVLASSWVRRKGLSEISVMAAPPPRLLVLGVEMYWIPCISRASSILLAWAEFSLFSQTSLCRPRCISFSRISSTRLLNFGKIERWLVTMMLGKERAVTARLSRLTVVRQGWRVACCCCGVTARAGVMMTGMLWILSFWGSSRIEEVDRDWSEGTLGRA